LKNSPLSPGVNVIGNFSSGAGIGKIAHGFVEIFKHLSIPCFSMDVYPENPGPVVSFPPTIEKGTFATNLICINPDIFPDLVDYLGQEFLADKYNIAMWWWEQEQFPEQWHDRFQLVDEVWTGSQFSQASIEAVSPVPVILIPPLVEKMKIPSTTTLPIIFGENEFVFLQSFDHFSLMERKNPLATVEAFKRAFGEDRSVRLIIKSMNAKAAPESASLLSLACNQPNITLIDSHFSEDQINALFAKCQCYVSLHRCEGFGLPLASTLLNEIPVIATGWSGNTEFMKPDSSYLVDYKLITLDRAHGPFAAGSRWAEPSVDHAAQLMLEVKSDYEAAKRRARKGSQLIQETFGMPAVAACVQARINELKRHEARSVE
jgi:glycosyltransferase involved in cell wall biosynthesis